MSFEYNNVLIAVDGSKTAEKALDKAIQVAKNNHADLILTNVIDTTTFSMIEPYDSSIYERSQKAAHEMLADYETKIKAAGFPSGKKIVKMGSPKSMITKEIIPEENIDLIVVGATGLGAVERILMGSVSEFIIRHATCDVLVTR